MLRDNVFGNQKDDAARRDFVNALYFDPTTETIIDYLTPADVAYPVGGGSSLQTAETYQQVARRPQWRRRRLPAPRVRLRREYEDLRRE